jgi:hypothetical protein
MNIQKHVEGHAVKVINKKSRTLKSNQTVNFVASIDTAQFILQGYETQEEIDTVMSEMLVKIIEIEHKFRFNNGIRKNKNGTVAQKYRNSSIDLSNTVAAYHNIGVNKFTSVEPHFHILFEKNEFYFYTLQTILQNAAQKYNLVFNFAEATRIDHVFSASQQLIAKRMSWLIQIKDNSGLESFINSDKFNEALSLFLEYTKKRDLISMAIKAMEYLKFRLSDLKIEKEVVINDRTYNLQEVYPLYLRKSDHMLLEKLINQKQIDVFPRDSILSREFLKHCYGFKSELINVLQYIGYDIPSLDIHNVKNRFEKTIKVKPKFDNEGSQDENTENVFITYLKECIMSAASYSKNEGDFLKNLKTVGQFESAEFQESSGTITGLKIYTFHEKQTKLFDFDFKRYGMSFERDLSPFFVTEEPGNPKQILFDYTLVKPIEEEYHSLEISKDSAKQNLFDFSETMNDDLNEFKAAIKFH